MLGSSDLPGTCQMDAKASEQLGGSTGQVRGRRPLRSCKDEPRGLQDPDKYRLVFTTLILKNK